MSAKKKIDFIEKELHPEVYQIFDKVRKFPENAEAYDANIQLYWKYEVNPDVDGNLELAKIQVCNPPNRKLHNRDAILYINYDAWNLNQDSIWREALLCHEVYHLALVRDKDDEPKLDADNKLVYRLRGHNREEFFFVEEKYGDWRVDHGVDMNEDFDESNGE